MAIDLLQDHGGKIATGIGTLILLLFRLLIGREFKRFTTAVDRVQSIDASYVSRDEVNRIVESIREEGRENMREIQERLGQLTDRIDKLWEQR